MSSFVAFGPSELAKPLSAVVSEHEPRAPAAFNAGCIESSPTPPPSLRLCPKNTGFPLASLMTLNINPSGSIADVGQLPEYANGFRPPDKPRGSALMYRPTAGS